MLIRYLSGIVALAGVVERQGEIDKCVPDMSTGANKTKPGRAARRGWARSYLLEAAERKPAGSPKRQDGNGIPSFCMVAWLLHTIRGGCDVGSFCGKCINEVWLAAAAPEVLWMTQS